MLDFRSFRCPFASVGGWRRWRMTCCANHTAAFETRLETPHSYGKGNQTDISMASMAGLHYLLRIKQPSQECSSES